jgi:predicted kinase
MPRLNHLNGSAGVGKSTVAQMYVVRHPGALNLDGDAIVSQIGGWRDDFWESVPGSEAVGGEYGSYPPAPGQGCCLAASG